MKKIYIFIIALIVLLLILLKKDIKQPEKDLFIPRASIEVQSKDRISYIPKKEEVLGVNDIVLYNLVNKYRKDNGLKTLLVSNELCNKAYLRSNQIKTNWSHDGFWNMKNRKGTFVHVGENLAKDFNSDGQILNAWILSKTHRNNMLNRWTHTCVVRNGTFIVQWFGR